MEKEKGGYQAPQQEGASKNSAYREELKRLSEKGADLKIKKELDRVGLMSQSDAEMEIQSDVRETFRGTERQRQLAHDALQNIGDFIAISRAKGEEIDTDMSVDSFLEFLSEKEQSLGELMEPGPEEQQEQEEQEE